MKGEKSKPKRTSDQNWLLRRRLNRLAHLLLIILLAIYFVATWLRPKLMIYGIWVSLGLSLLYWPPYLFFKFKDRAAKKRQEESEAN